MAPRPSSTRIFLRALALAGSCGLGLLAAGCDPGAQAVIGPDGGALASEDGRLLLDFPEGALPQDTLIRIDESDDAPVGAVGPSYVVEPDGRALSAPVWVIFELSGRESAEVLQVDAPSQRVRAVGRGRDGWSALPDADIDADSGIVEGSALFLSTFAVRVASQPESS